MARVIEHTRGNDKSFTATFRDGTAGTAFDITNWTVVFSLKKHYELPDAESSLLKVFGTHAQGTAGICTIELTRSDTLELPVRLYDFEILVTTDHGKSYTVLKGKYNLSFNVAHGTAGTAGTGGTSGT